MTRTTAVVAMTAALAASTVMAAQAAIPDAEGVITSCVGKSGGVRIIDAEDGEHCLLPETHLTWNQRGPAGPRGPEGPQGRDGVVETVQFVGGGGAPISPTVGFQFYGPPREVLITEGQRITASATAAFGPSGGGEAFIRFGICRQPVGAAGSVIPLQLPPTVRIEGSFNPVSTAATSVMPPGQWLIGSCVATPASLITNSPVTGWAMVTDGS